MNINFAAIDENFIKDKVADGYYSNATELVRDAVRRLRESEDQAMVRLKAALEEGERDIREGRVKEYTPGYVHEIAERVLKSRRK